MKTRDDYLQDWALKGFIITPVELQEGWPGLSGTWFRFDDRETCGFAKIPWVSVYIQLGFRAQASSVFKLLFGFFPGDASGCAQCGNWMEVTPIVFPGYTNSPLDLYIKGEDAEDMLKSQGYAPAYTLADLADPPEPPPVHMTVHDAVVMHVPVGAMHSYQDSYGLDLSALVPSVTADIMKHYQNSVFAAFGIPQSLLGLELELSPKKIDLEAGGGFWGECGVEHKTVSMPTTPGLIKFLEEGGVSPVKLETGPTKPGVIQFSMDSILPWSK